jgi:hypothetical protein
LGVKPELRHWFALGIKCRNRRLITIVLSAGSAVHETDQTTT